MAYFEGLAQSGFNKDERGRHLFFPFGKLGKGYILDSEASYQTMLKFNKYRYIIMVILILTSGILFQWQLIPLAMTVFLFGVADYGVVKLKVKNLERTVNSFDAKQSEKRAVKTFGLPLLIVCETIMVIFVLIGCSLLTTGEDFPVAFLTIGVFGFFAYLGGRKIQIALAEKAGR